MARMKENFIVLLIAVAVLTYLIAGDMVCKKTYIIGDRESALYHLPSCSLLGGIPAENKVAFTESIYNAENWESAARAAAGEGYKPCQVCNPPGGK